MTCCQWRQKKTEGPELREGHGRTRNTLYEVETDSAIAHESREQTEQWTTKRQHGLAAAVARQWVLLARRELELETFGAILVLEK